MRCSSTRQITETVLALYDRIVDPVLSVRRITISVCRLVTEAEWAAGHICEQLNLFANSETCTETIARDREQRRQEAFDGAKDKGGLKKMIYQTAWKEDGKVAGLVEISMVIPEAMPHYDRG